MFEPWPVYDDSLQRLGDRRTHRAVLDRRPRESRGDSLRKHPVPRRRSKPRSRLDLHDEGGDVVLKPLAGVFERVPRHRFSLLLGRERPVPLDDLDQRVGPRNVSRRRAPR